MATRLERAQLTVEREERRADQKNLKRAREALSLALTFLHVYNTDYSERIDKIGNSIAENSVNLDHIIAEMGKTEK